MGDALYPNYPTVSAAVRYTAHTHATTVIP